MRAVVFITHDIPLRVRLIDRLERHFDFDSKGRDRES